MIRLKLILLFCTSGLLILGGCGKGRILESSKSPKKMKNNAEELIRQENEALLKNLRQKNPFRPDHLSSSSPVIASSESRGLKGIFWDNKKAFALFGDSVVKEGDVIEGKRIIKIHKDSVIVEENGLREVLRLEED